MKRTFCFIVALSAACLGCGPALTQADRDHIAQAKVTWLALKDCGIGCSRGVLRTKQPSAGILRDEQIALLWESKADGDGAKVQLRWHLRPKDEFAWAKRGSYLGAAELIWAPKSLSVEGGKITHRQNLKAQYSPTQRRDGDVIWDEPALERFEMPGRKGWEKPYALFEVSLNQGQWKAFQEAPASGFRVGTKTGDGTWIIQVPGFR